MCARIGLSQLRSFGDYKLKGGIRKNFFVTKKGEKFISSLMIICSIAHYAEKIGYNNHGSM